MEDIEGFVGVGGPWTVRERDRGLEMVRWVDGFRLGLDSGEDALDVWD